MSSLSPASQSDGARRVAPTPEQDAYVSLLRAQDLLMAEASELVKKSGLSHQQYNVLRILRGAGPSGLPCQEIGRRMINRDPDITRLLDRLVKAEFVRRERGHHDRRVVLAVITESGLAKLEDLDAPVKNLHREQFATLTPEELTTLTGLLDRVQARDPISITRK